MDIVFEPTGERVSGVGINVTVQTLAGLGELAAPVYTTPDGYTPVQTVLTSGSPAQILAGQYSSGFFLRFFASDNKTLLVTKFRMDDEAALALAQTTIDTALLADTEVIVLNSDGSLGS